MNGTIVYPCPTCGQQYTLDPSYLAQYGGQSTTCSRCQQPFVLPQAGQIPMAQPAYAAPPYGASPMLGYATPQGHAQPGYGVWRDGRLVVAANGVQLPHACVKCGQPGSGSQFRRTYYWHSPWIYLTILAGLLIYVIVALCVRGKGTVMVSLCAEHRSARARNLTVGWLVFLSSIVMWFAAGMVRDRDLPPFLVLGGFVAFFVGILMIAFSSRILTPSRIADGHLWLKGAGEGFLSQLPSAGGYTGGQGFPVQFRR